MANTLKKLTEIVDRAFFGFQKGPQLLSPPANDLSAYFNQHPELTKFESDILKRLEWAKDHGSRIVFASVDPTDSFNPVTKETEKGYYTVSMIDSMEPIERRIDSEYRLGRMTVMILDSKKTLEEQVEGWKPGTFQTPQQLLETPVITVEEAKEVLIACPYGKGLVPRTYFSSDDNKVNNVVSPLILNI